MAGSEPDANVSVPVHGGLYSILLGNTEIPGMEPLEPSTFWINSALYLRVWFSDGVNGFQQLTPDRPLASVPMPTCNLSFWAQSAGSANTVKAGAITTAQLNEQILKYLKPEITHPAGTRFNLWRADCYPFPVRRASI